ncbi:MAG: FAD-binding oxidoreductase [Brevefilum sp.]
MRKLHVISNEGVQITLDDKTINTFKSELKGNLILPDDKPYKQERLVWNGLIDKCPAMIAGCVDEQDVINAVNFARRHNLVTAVRGGGHNVAGLGTCEGGLVIDLSGMTEVEVDPDQRIASVSGGATWADVDEATQEFGLATPGGVVSDTGVGGLTLGGGYGHLRNKFGLSCDNLLAADVVTADGNQIRASKSENPELLWGLRGGGGNFGVVTRFEFMLHPLGPNVYMCLVFHPAEHPEKAVGFFRQFSESAPDEVSALLFRGIIPEGAEDFPQEVQNQPFVAFMAVYAGDPAEGEQILEPLSKFDAALIDFSGIMPYKNVQSILDEDYPAHEMRYYWKSLNLKGLPDEAIEVFAEYASRQPSEYSTSDLWHVGKGIKCYGSEHGAFNGRQAEFLLNPEANWFNKADDQANIEWVRSFLEAMKPFSSGGLYLNFAGLQEEGDDMMKSAYSNHYERLAALKKAYDPENLFRVNHNIEPANS